MRNTSSIQTPKSRQTPLSQDSTSHTEKSYRRFEIYQAAGIVSSGTGIFLQPGRVGRNCSLQVPWDCRHSFMIGPAGSSSRYSWSRYGSNLVFKRSLQLAMAVFEELLDEDGKRLVASRVASDTNYSSSLRQAHRPPAVYACEASWCFDCNVTAIVGYGVYGCIEDTAAPQLFGYESKVILDSIFPGIL